MFSLLSSKDFVDSEQINETDQLFLLTTVSNVNQQYSFKKKKKILSLSPFLTFLTQATLIADAISDDFNVTTRFNPLECPFQKLSQMYGTSFSGVAAEAITLLSFPAAAGPF